MTLNEKLLSLRKKEGLSQESLAEKLGVTRQTISNWESGQTSPDLLQAGKISEIYHWMNLLITNWVLYAGTIPRTIYTRI